MPCDANCHCEPIEEAFGFEDFEEFNEQEPDVYSQKQIVGFSVNAEDNKFAIPAKVDFRVTSIALALSNESKSRHVISITYGEMPTETYVVARLIPGVIESVSVDILVPAQIEDQKIGFTVSGTDCGAVDIVGMLQYVKDDKEEKKCCQEESQSDFDDDFEEEQPAIKTLQQQRDELLKEKLMKAAVKEEEKAQKMKEESSTGFRTFKGLQVRDDFNGRGRECKVGMQAVMKYELRLTNEKGKVLDATKGNQKFKFTVGRGEVIKGWDLGIPGMKEGSKRTIIVPPHLGYGGKQTGPIPANSTLYFTVELIQVI